MFSWQCPNCGWAGQLTDEAQAAAVIEADKIQATHHIEHCPRCQWVVRLPIDLLRVEVAAPAAKKPAVKKSAANKPVAKKAVTKKPATRKKVVKKAVVQRAAAKKKSVAKLTTPKRKK